MQFSWALLVEKNKNSDGVAAFGVETGLQGVVDPFLGANCAGVVITHALTSLDARPVSWPHVHIVLEFHRASESFKTRACVTTIK